MTALMLSACSMPADLGLSSQLSGDAQADSEAPAAEAKSSSTSRPSRDWAQAYKASPDDPQVALGYARTLKKAGEKLKAMGVLERAAGTAPGNARVMAEQGLLALELGQVKKAHGLLLKAQAADKTDWRVVSGLGSVAAHQGKLADARGYFAKALELAPGKPSVLNNLAMTYLMEGKAEDAEKLLKQAKGEGALAGQIAQNLALTLALKGRRDEAVQVASAHLPKPVASANADYVAQLREASGTAQSVHRMTGDPVPPAGRSEEPQPRAERTAASTQ